MVRYHHGSLLAGGPAMGPSASKAGTTSGGGSSMKDGRRRWQRACRSLLPGLFGGIVLLRHLSCKGPCDVMDDFLCRPPFPQRGVALGRHRGARARRRRRSVAHRPLPVAAPPIDSIATAPPALNGESQENAGGLRMPEEH